MARIQKKYYYIYKTTCSVNGKYYIGMHSTDNLGDGYIGSGKRLWNSIKYYGKETHVKEILEYCKNKEELVNLEKKIVNEQLLSEELCMNLKLGGDAGWHENAKKTHHLKLTEDLIYKENYSKKLSKANKEQYNDGRRNRFYFYDWNGKKHSDETKKKLSEIKKGTGVGEKNSVWGRKWMNKNLENKMIKPEDVNFYLEDGWVFGKISILKGEKNK